MTAYATTNQMPFSAAELTLDELNLVTGGTFTSNKYSKSFYHACGISTCYNFFDKDEFMFMARKSVIRRQMKSPILQAGFTMY